MIVKLGKGFEIAIENPTTLFRVAAHGPHAKATNAATRSG
jgi:hypothetical protein